MKDWFDKPAVALALIALVACMCYANSFKVPLQWDDNINLRDTPFVQDLTIYKHPSITSQHTAYQTFTNRIVGYFTFALNFAADGFNARGYHAVNLLIHIINAMLVYALATLVLGRGSPVALIAALLFVAHPVQTQAVTYIVQRFTSLATMFYLASIVLYARSRGRWWVYALSLVSAALAMKTKETAFTVPLIIALYELVFGGRRMRWAIPFLLLLPIIPMGHMGDGLDAASRLQSTMPRADYLMVELRVVATYLRLLVLPVGQNIDYDYPLNAPLYLTIVSGALHMGLIAAALYAIRRAGCLRLAGFGVLWFYITMSVESGVIPIEDVIFEHRMYLPSVGMLIALACAFNQLRWRAWVPVLVLLCALTIARNTVWATPVSLWLDASIKSPNKARVLNNLGDAYKTELRYDEALDAFARAAQIEPLYKTAQMNLALVYWAKGDARGTIAQYERYLARWPMDYEAHNNLALAYAASGRGELAIRHYAQAIALAPWLIEPHLNLAMLYMGTGRMADARAEAGEVLRLTPSEPRALGIIRAAASGAQRR